MLGAVMATLVGRIVSYGHLPCESNCSHVLAARSWVSCLDWARDLTSQTLSLAARFRHALHPGHQPNGYRDGEDLGSRTT